MKKILVSLVFTLLCLAHIRASVILIPMDLKQKEHLKAYGITYLVLSKGIEAHWLFAADYSQIEVVVHPQSIIHSLVEFSDGSVLAQLGWPDMKLPIQYALSWPDRWQQPLPALDLVKVSSMTFSEPRLADFPCLKLAFAAGKVGGIMPCVLNAANEVAVAAFMQRKISFVEIPVLISQTIDSFTYEPASSINQLIAFDIEARRKAEELAGINL